MCLFASRLVNLMVFQTRNPIRSFYRLLRRRGILSPNLCTCGLTIDLGMPHEETQLHKRQSFLSISISAFHNHHSQMHTHRTSQCIMYATHKYQCSLYNILTHAFMKSSNNDYIIEYTCFYQSGNIQELITQDHTNHTFQL